MKTSFVVGGLGFALVLLSIVVLGCTGSQQPESMTNEPHEHGAESDHEHTDHDHGASDSHEQAEIRAALAKLSPADRTLAEEQKICPVSDEPLGSMGTPIKVSVEGREVFVCCKGCINEVKDNFDKYSTKLEGHSGAN